MTDLDPAPPVPWQHRLSTRLTLLLLGVVAVLTAAMAVPALLLTHKGKAKARA